MSGGVTENVHKTIEEIKAMNLFGCITGSSLLDANFDTWDTAPDVDVFVYTEMALVQAITKLEASGNYDYLTKGEEWKTNRTISSGSQKKAFLNTIKMVNKDTGIIVNVTWKKACKTMVDVISSFDMSIVMVGYDLVNNCTLDLREQWSTKDVAVPNKLRRFNTDLWTVDNWVRQFDRVIKYWGRGYDTRNMARTYIKMIDDVIETGSLFQTKKSEEIYETYAQQFVEQRELIAQWLEDKED